jgi:hypothetical protein
MTEGWQNSLDFLEDEHIVKKEFPPTGQLEYVSENPNVVDERQTAKGSLIQKEFILSEAVSPVALDAGVRSVVLQFSAKYTGYHPIELKSFSFLEIPQHELYGNSRLQALDCARWHQFNTTGLDTGAPGILVSSQNQAGVIQKSAIVGLHNVAEGWFPADANGDVYKPRLLPGEKFYFAIKITPPSNPDYQILSADSFHLKFEFNFDELNEKRLAQINDEDFEVCIPE